jgi:2-C-methyl-D-erythritol 4-phosphate cytidylyltransferase
MTESRDARWRALTPQLFRYGELVAALTAAAAAGAAVTDEAMAMERNGHRPLLIEGAESNIKVTTPADFALAEFLIHRTTPEA